MNGPMTLNHRSWVGVLLLAALVHLPAPAAAQGPGSTAGCALCHGNLEFLRQHSPDLPTARRRLVTMEHIRASAHADSTCASCHRGFERWPHPATSRSMECGSCHGDVAAAWHQGVHGEPDQPGAEPVDCAQCHTEHHTASLDSLRMGSAMAEMNATCVGCHETSGLPPGDPHLDQVGCASCHRAHDTRDVDEVDASVSPSSQVETCGSCHQEVAAAAHGDVHGEALGEHRPVGLATLELLDAGAPPTCTTCHGTHGMATREGLVPMVQTEVCGHCHEHALETFDDSYHGQANALGSVAVASCSDCHGTHGIYGAEDPRSMVHEDNLVESCGQCHEASRAAFVLYQPHADHNDKENYPLVYWTYRLMTALLVGVFSVFGLHSALWVVRLTLDSLRASKGGA